MPDTTDAAYAQAVADAQARQAMTPEERKTEEASRYRAHAEAAALEAGVPFDRYAYEHKVWREELAEAGQKVLGQDQSYRGVGNPTVGPADALLVGGVWVEGPWRRFTLGNRNEWLSDGGVIVAPADVQARRVRRHAPDGGPVDVHPDVTAWNDYSRLLAAEPTPDCPGSGTALNPADTDDALMIGAGAAWCFECERTVPVVPGAGAIERDDRWPELVRHDRNGRPVA